MTIVPGSGGVFDVAVNGKLVYSKQKTGTFPDYEADIAKALG